MFCAVPVSDRLYLSPLTAAAMMMSVAGGARCQIDKRCYKDILKTFRVGIRGDERGAVE